MYALRTSQVTVSGQLRDPGAAIGFVIPRFHEFCLAMRGSGFTASFQESVL